MSGSMSLAPVASSTHRRARAAVGPAHGEAAIAVALDGLDAAGGEAHAVRLGVAAHVADELRAVDAARKAGDVVRARNARGAARPSSTTSTSRRKRAR